MKLSKQVTDIVLGAEAKALATGCGGSINVVPVSVIKIVGDEIWLANFFMGKTVKNIIADPHVALVCWKGTEGYQIKADAAYITDGDAFEKAKQWIADVASHRTINGLLVLRPIEVFDISPFKERAGVKVM